MLDPAMPVSRRPDPGVVLKEPVLEDEGVGKPVSRVGSGWPGLGFVPASRVAVVDAAFGNAAVSRVEPVEAAGAVGRSVSRLAPEVAAACVAGPASGLEGGAVTVASLMGSGCAEMVFAGFSTLEAVGASDGFGSDGFGVGLSVGNGAPGSGPSLIAFGTGSGARACGAWICFAAFGLRIGAGTFVTRGATPATGFSGTGFTA